MGVLVGHLGKSFAEDRDGDRRRRGRNERSLRAGRGGLSRAAGRAARLPGRARTSYLHPGVGEVIDNCQHVLFGCCTNPLGFYRRIGAADRIHWTREMTMIEPGGRRSRLGRLNFGLAAARAAARRCQFLHAKAFTLADKLSLGRAMQAMMKPGALDDSDEKRSATWLRRHRQTEGALKSFWRLVIASALNAEIDSIAVPYAAKVIRELFLNSRRGRQHGNEYGSAERIICGCHTVPCRARRQCAAACACEGAAWMRPPASG